MARVPILNDRDPETPGEIREALEYVEEDFGPPLDIQHEMANHPLMVRVFIDLATVSYAETI